MHKATECPLMTCALGTREETLKKPDKFWKQMRLNYLGKQLAKQNVDRIRSQQIGESCGIQPINECVERRRREWHEHVTSMDAGSLFKIPKDNTRRILRTSEKKLERLNPWLKQAEPPIRRRRRWSSILWSYMCMRMMHTCQLLTSYPLARIHG